MDRTACRLTAAITHAAVSTFAVPLAHTQSAAEVSVAVSVSNGSDTNGSSGDDFNGFMDSYVWDRNVIALG